MVRQRGQSYETWCLAAGEDELARSKRDPDLC